MEAAESEPQGGKTGYGGGAVAEKQRGVASAKRDAAYGNSASWVSWLDFESTGFDFWIEVAGCVFRGNCSFHGVTSPATKPKNMLHGVCERQRRGVGEYFFELAGKKGYTCPGSPLWCCVRWAAGVEEHAFQMGPGRCGDNHARSMDESSVARFRR